MVLVLVLMGAVFIFISTFDVNRFKPQILSEAKKALSREVNFEKASLGISLFQGISLRIKNLSVAEDQALEKGNFLTIKDISLAVDVWKYIFKKEVSVPNVLIQSYAVTIIRQKDGPLNIRTIGQSGRGTKESAKPIRTSTPIVVPVVLVSSAKGSNGTVTFIDQTRQPPLRLEVSQLNFSLNNISLAKPFPFIVEAAFLSTKKNIKLKGKAQINLKTNEVTISEFKATSELSDIALEKIPAVFTLKQGAVLPVALKGEAAIALDKLAVGPQGVTGLSADAFLANGFLQFKEMGSPIKDLNLHMRISDNKVMLDKAYFSIGKGVINASGIINDYLAKQEYSIEGEAKNLTIDNLIVQDKSAVKAQGLISSSLRLKGEGFSPDALKANLSGEANVSVTQVKLKNMNLLREVLDKISIIPGLAQRVAAGLPERYKQKLQEQDTQISDIKMPMDIASGRITVKDVVFEADEFIFNCSGEIGFDSIYTLQGVFLIPQELSASMVTQVPELQYFLNDEKQIYIPLKILGKGGKPELNVDIEYLAKRLLMNQAKQQLFKALDKAIGTKEQVPEATGTDTSQPDTNTKSAGEEIIGDILDNIFKK
jgi:hypothetical protein